MPVSPVGLSLLEGRVGALAAREESLSFDLSAVVLRRGDPDFRVHVGKALDDTNRTGEIERYLHGSHHIERLIHARGTRHG